MCWTLLRGIVLAFALGLLGRRVASTCSPAEKVGPRGLSPAPICMPSKLAAKKASKILPESLLEAFLEGHACPGAAPAMFSSSYCTRIASSHSALTRNGFIPQRKWEIIVPLALVGVGDTPHRLASCVLASQEFACRPGKSGWDVVVRLIEAVQIS